MAKSKVRFFEEKYRISLVELDTKGLPDDADHEMHEDYIMWHHWTEALEKARKQVIDLETIAAYGEFNGKPCWLLSVYWSPFHTTNM